jgi:predicted GIY-YIG superfamily endonuclease
MEIKTKGRATADNVRFYYVYILLCFDNKPYIGCTDNLKDRIIRHQRGQVLATCNRLPVKLIAYCAFDNKYIAFNFEKYLKSGSGRAFLKKHEVIGGV